MLNIPVYIHREKKKNRGQASLVNIAMPGLREYCQRGSKNDIENVLLWLANNGLPFNAGLVAT